MHSLTGSVCPCLLQSGIRSPLVTNLSWAGDHGCVELGADGRVELCDQRRCVHLKPIFELHGGMISTFLKERRSQIIFVQRPGVLHAESASVTKQHLNREPSDEPYFSIFVVEDERRLHQLADSRAQLDFKREAIQNFERCTNTDRDAKLL